jgi:hypothetical protein
MSTADLQKIGGISLLDLDIIGTYFGREYLPYPFMRTQPSGFSWHDEYVEYARSVPDRFNNGDLRMFQDCVGAYANADIRVECLIQYIPSDTSCVRVLAYRIDQAGFLAKQRPDEDIIDIYELSPYLLGSAVAEEAALEKPGRRTGIVVPEYAPASDYMATCDDVGIRSPIERAPSSIEVPCSEVSAYGTVQSHWHRTRSWGVDPGKTSAVWVRIKDDGEYLYKPDFTKATPVTRPVLAERIDLLISEDVKALRQFRNA